MVLEDAHVRVLAGAATAAVHHVQRAKVVRGEGELVVVLLVELGFLFGFCVVLFVDVFDDDHGGEVFEAVFLLVLFQHCEGWHLEALLLAEDFVVVTAQLVFELERLLQLEIGEPFGIARQ
uniref:(northern house mosquito) hypothetical protein n=1 Tax=Culex pipiens TaxID=7175 RepID=A0A8D8NF41_CULPI